MKAVLKRLIPESIRRARRDNQWRKQWMGGQFSCNFCEASLKEFDWRGVESPIIQELDIVPAGKRRATCPFCGSYDRDRLLWFYLEKYGDLGGRQMRVLHIAPDFTIERKLKQFSNIDYLSGDLDPDLAMTKVDVTAMEFESDSFDLVLCNHVLEHVLDVTAAMKELLRVTSEGGTAILQVPIGRKLAETIEDVKVTDSQERLRRFGQNDHFRVFAKDDYVNRLRSAGWQVEEHDMIFELGTATVEKYRLNPGEVLFVCRKPRMS